MTLPPVQPGEAVLWSVSNDEYHATHEAVGNSMLQCFRKSPARYRGLYVDGSIPKKDPSIDMRIGSWTHCLTLEPDSFGDLYAVEPEGERRTNIGKGIYAGWQMTVGDREIIEKKHAEQLQLARDMALAVWAHPVASVMLQQDGTMEQGILWRDPVTGILCKAKPDRLLTSFGGYPCDVSLKTAADPTEYAFSCEVRKRDYDMQAALYRETITALTGKMASTVQIVVGKDVPHDVYCYRMPSVWFELGRRKLRDALCRLQICQETGVWLAEGQDGLTDLEPEKWYERTLEI